MLLITIRDAIFWESIKTKEFIDEVILTHHILTDMDILEFIETYEQATRATCAKYIFNDKKMEGWFEIINTQEVSCVNPEKWQNHPGHRHISVKVILKKDNKSLERMREGER
jgi:hypothetical protein